MNSPFQQSLNTFAIAATVASSVAVQISDGVTGIQSSAYAVRIYNAGPNDVFIRISDTGSAAVVPTVGSPQPAYPLPVGAIEIVSAAPDSYITTICATGTASVYCTPGFGI